VDKESGWANVSRPSEYTLETADRICEQLAEGMSLRSVCKADDMPSTVTVFKWLRTYPEFLSQYARAKEESADALADEMLDIADESERDTVIDENGNARPNNEWISRSRLRVDTRKWIASKLKPKKYGDKLELAGDPKAPLTVMLAAASDERV
jgi:hypothetical protein